MTSKQVPPLLNDYKTDKFLGKGSFSSVFNSYKDGTRYAMKRVNSEDRFKKCALNEIKLLSEVNSQYIVRLEDNFIHKNIQYLVFEYLHDNLYNYVVKKENYPNFKTLLRYSYQMAEGLSYLHSRDIVHCDFKLENMMICSDLKNIKIIDLGSSVRADTKVKNNFYIQSRYYRAPEILYRINFNTKIDIWSYGVLVTELILRSNIFNGKDASHMIYKIADYIDIPTSKDYQDTDYFRKLFYNDRGAWIYSSQADNFKVKGYRENRLEEYLINGLKNNFNDLYDYQIENTVSFIHKILEYDYDKRLTADQCKDEVVLLEHIIDKEVVHL
jgi:serine/threonine protein kinase